MDSEYVYNICKSIKFKENDSKNPFYFEIKYIDGNLVIILSLCNTSLMDYVLDEILLYSTIKHLKIKPTLSINGCKKRLPNVDKKSVKTIANSIKRMSIDPLSFDGDSAIYYDNNSNLLTIYVGQDIGKKIKKLANELQNQKKILGTIGIDYLGEFWSFD